MPHKEATSDKDIAITSIGCSNNCNRLERVRSEPVRRYMEAGHKHNSSNTSCKAWEPGKLESVSDNKLVWTLKVDGDELRKSSPMGESYEARLNGPVERTRGTGDGRS